MRQKSFPTAVGSTVMLQRSTGGWICSPFPGLGTQGQGCGQNSGVQPLGHSSSHSWKSLGKRDSSSGSSMLLRHKSGKLVLVKQFSLFWSGSANSAAPFSPRGSTESTSHHLMWKRDFPNLICIDFSIKH